LNTNYRKQDFNEITFNVELLLNLNRKESATLVVTIDLVLCINHCSQLLPVPFTFPGRKCIRFTKEILKIQLKFNFHISTYNTRNKNKLNIEKKDQLGTFIIVSIHLFLSPAVSLLDVSALDWLTWILIVNQHSKHMS